MKDVFVLHPEYFAPETIDEIIKCAEKLPVVPAKVGAEQVVDNIRRSELRWIHRSNDDFSSVFNCVEDLFQKANQKSFGFDIKYLPSFQFTTYPSNITGHYDWHVDVFWQTEVFYQRKLSFVMQLTDPSEYEGGVLELDEWQKPDPELLKKRGSIVIFPSFVKHRVTPVTKGTRQSLVGWMEGPLWR